MRLVVDGVIFQFGGTAITRAWLSVLKRLCARPDLDVFILDRGGVPKLPNFRLIAFPSFTHTANAEDSSLIQKICRHYGADIFLSTYITTPLTTPSIMVALGTACEPLELPANSRDRKERELCFRHARRIVCTSENARSTLRSELQRGEAGKLVVEKIGFERNAFYPADVSDAVASGIAESNRPYVLLVGPEAASSQRISSDWLFRALARMQQCPFDVVCVGVGASMGVGVKLPEGCRILHRRLNEAQLGDAYREARALFHPISTDGLGVSILEAMACGCPVITTGGGALSELTGDAAIVISGDDAAETLAALRQTGELQRRGELRARGLRQAAKYDWDRFADVVVKSLVESERDGRMPDVWAFYQQWERLRAIQADVDVDVFAPDRELS